MKALYNKRETMELLGIGRHKLNTLVEDDSLVLAGGSITRESIEGILGYPIEGGEQLGVAREPTAIEVLEEQIEEKEQRVREYELTAQLQGWAERDAERQRQEKELAEATEEFTDLRDEAIGELHRLLRVGENKDKKAADLLVLVDEVVPAAEAKAADIIAGAEVKAKGIRDAAQEVLTEQRNIRDGALETARIQIARAEQTLFDADQHRILLARIEALPEKVRDKHFPKANRAFLPLPEDKDMPVLNPGKSEPEPEPEVIVDQSRGIPKGSLRKVVEVAVALIVIGGIVALIASVVGGIGC